MGIFIISHVEISDFKIKLHCILQNITPRLPSRYRSVLGCFVIEGYGQTENCGVGTMSMYGDTIPGHVGTPAPGTNIKLDDVPEMNYRASQGKGEVGL